MENTPPLWKQLLGALTGSFVALVGYFGYTSFPQTIAFARNTFLQEETLVARVAPDFPKAKTRSEKDLQKPPSASSNQSTTTVTTGESATLLAAPMEDANASIPRNEEEASAGSVSSLPPPPSILAKNTSRGTMNTSSRATFREKEVYPDTIIDPPVSPPSPPTEAQPLAIHEENAPAPVLPSTGPGVLFSAACAGAVAWLRRKQHHKKGNIR